jgi:hypothetical protein
VSAGGEREAEVVGGGGRFTGDGDGLLDHLTESDAVLLLCGGCGAVRRVTVPVWRAGCPGVRP